MKPSSAIGAKTLAAWIGGAAAVGLLVSVAGAWALLPDDDTDVSEQAGGAAASAASLVSAAASAPASAGTASASALPSLVERAEQGDSRAIEQIDGQPADRRTVREALAWARGKSKRRHQDLESIAKELQSNLPLSADEETMAKLWPYTKDPRTATEALSILASLRTPMAADMLYEVWVGTRAKNDTTQLAKRLLYTEQVRESVSEALAVALDLRAATSCEEVAEILPRAEEHGDRRSLMLLGKLNFRYGCGRRGGQDCYSCLRGTSAINDAIAAVRRRPAP